MRHFRGETELQPIAQENNYDFNFQDFQRTSGECVIMPDDQITVECTYNTMSRDKPLFVSLINYMLYKYENISIIQLKTFIVYDSMIGRTVYQRRDVYGFPGLLSKNEVNANLFEWSHTTSSYETLRRGSS